VVAALDLDDRLALGVGARGADGVHQRLGAGVGEAEHVEPEALLAALTRSRSPGRGGHEQRADLRRARGDGGDHDGVEVADEHGPEAHRQVEHAAAVDVGEVGAPRARDR
jgi:hypothetical protein